MTNCGKKARRGRNRMREILERLPPKQLDQARRILERLEECQRQREAGLPAPTPTFDDILSDGR